MLLLQEWIYTIGDFRLPPRVVEAINAKIEATQLAQQRENEVREAEAEAQGSDGSEQITRYKK